VVSEYTVDRRDARGCPQCGVRGILPLHQEPGEGATPGTIENPVMICPVCDAEFRATGMTGMGAVSVSDMTDDELELLADAAIARMLEVTRR
jgi:hypothetical protein